MDIRLGKLIWITGLSGSGKTTIGKKVYHALKKKYINTIFLDGDDFRQIFDNDLKYSLQDRLQNAKRIHRMCKFLISQNFHVVCATISLFKEIHKLNKAKIKNYYDIYIECQEEELIKRNQKNLYKQALMKKRKDVVGINYEYDIPPNPKLILDNNKKNNLKKKVEIIMNAIKENN